MWCHQKTSFIPKWLYIFLLKNRNKRNLPLLIHLSSEFLILSNFILLTGYLLAASLVPL